MLLTTRNLLLSGLLAAALPQPSIAANIASVRAEASACVSTVINDTGLLAGSSASQSASISQMCPIGIDAYSQAISSSSGWVSPGALGGQAQAQVGPGANATANVMMYSRETFTVHNWSSGAVYLLISGILDGTLDGSNDFIFTARSYIQVNVMGTDGSMVDSVLLVNKQLTHTGYTSSDEGVWSTWVVPSDGKFFIDTWMYVEAGVDTDFAGTSVTADFNSTGRVFVDVDETQSPGLTLSAESSVPEPGTFALLLSGTAVVAAIRRFRP